MEPMAPLVPLQTTYAEGIQGEVESEVPSLGSKSSSQTLVLGCTLEVGRSRVVGDGGSSFFSPASGDSLH